MTASTQIRETQSEALVAGSGQAGAELTQSLYLAAYGPPASRDIRVTQDSVLVAQGAGDLTVNATDYAFLMAYSTGQPSTSRQSAWTFVMDGHRFYVLPLGPQGDWAYDTTTQEWCQLQTQGFDGINFVHGVMWGIRVIGGDSLYTYVMELDPTQPLDEGWRPIERIVTGGIATRGRSAVGVANFSLTASVDDDSSIAIPISLAFSDDNGATWSREFDIPLTDVGSQLLIWNALGSFAAPGRIFRITDFAGPVRLDGADVVLTIGSGADSGQDQEGQQKR